MPQWIPEWIQMELRMQKGLVQVAVEQQQKKTAVMAELKISVGSAMVTVLPELDSIFK